MNINEAISKYTKGEITTEEVNAVLTESGAGFSFIPGQNELTEEDLRATTVGHYPDMANGYGLLDSGTGTLDKVQVKKGKLLSGPVNTVGADGMPNEKDIVYIGGQTWQVYGDELGNIAPQEIPWWVPYHTFTGAVAWPDELDKYIPEKDMMFNRPKYHGQEVVKGAIRYIYAEDGSAQYQPKSMRDYDKDHGRV